MGRRLLFGLLAAAVAGTSCGDQGMAPCRCTENFASVYAVVVSRALVAPVPVTDVAIRLTRSQEVLDVSQDHLDRGSIRVIDDGFISKLSSDNEQIAVSGLAESAPFETRITVAVDGPCRCHVTKISGPTYIMIP